MSRSGFRWLVVALLAIALVPASPALAQRKSSSDRKKEEAAAKVDKKKSSTDEEQDRKEQAARELERRLAAGEKSDKEAAAQNPIHPAGTKSPDFFKLWFMGGPLMIPITAISFVVVALTFERWLALRRRRLIPKRLVKGLDQLATRPGGFDPRAAYQLCRENPSTAASVVRAVLRKVGRPASEIEHSMEEACEQEAARLYKPVRTINLATTIAPLLGLLGTVQGMIACFFITSQLALGADKSKQLADGIYIALVTTFGGLCVAIPASVIAHYFEGRIQSIFRDVHELVNDFIPTLDRFEGKLRLVVGPDGEASLVMISPSAAESPKRQAAQR